jgi:hypothetical protein
LVHRFLSRLRDTRPTVNRYRLNVMALSATFHHAFWRDLTRAYVLLVIAAIGALLLLWLSIYWSQGPRAPAASAPPGESGDGGRYTGSIMTELPHGDLCWERIFDNRTGTMWDNGYVKCDTEPAQVAGPSQGQGLERLREVGRAFRRKAD